MQAVGGHQPPGPQPRGGDLVAVLLDRPHAPAHPVDPDLLGPAGQCGVQGGPPDPEAGTGPELRGHRTARRQVADPDERPAGHRHAQPVEGGNGGRHQALAAGLVDGDVPGLDHGDRQSRRAGADGDSEPHRTAARDEQVDVGHTRLRSARSSAAIRVRSRAAFATVNTAAVTQAVCTSGRAMPSSTTAR